MSAAGKHSQPYPWEQRKLGEIADVSSGTSIDSRATHGRNRVTRIETIANGEIDYKHIGWTNENIDPRYNLKINDILYSNINSIDHIGKNAIIKTLPFPLYHGMNLLRIVPRINSLFMFYSLNTIEHRIWAKSHANKAVSQASINQSTLNNQPFKVPKLEEQEKIGQLFQFLDKTITLHEEKQRQLERLKKALLQKMFADKTGYPALRFKGFTEKWEQRKLGEIATIVGGGTPSTKNPEYWDGDINWYSPAEIGNQIYIEKSERQITELGLKKSSAKLLPVGTVLFTSRAGIGKTAILNKEACTNQGFQSIIPRSKMLNSYFLFSRTNSLKQYGETMGSGSTFVEVSGKQMSKMPLFIPNINEQSKIAKLFQSLDRTITLHDKKIQYLKQLKRGLLQKMFV